MRLLVCSLTYPLPNGVSSSINESVDGFVAAGHEVIIVSPDYGLGQARPEHRSVSSSKLASAVVRLFGKKERMFGIRSVAEINAIIEEFQPDAYWLHTITWASNAFERIMLRSDKAKVITYHTLLDLYGKLYGGTIAEQRMIKRSAEVSNAVDRVITPSHFMEQRLLQYGVTKPIDVVSTGIVAPKKMMSRQELNKRWSIRADHDVLMYVGRVVKEKNIDALMDALKGVIKTNPHTTLVLVGPGDIKETLEHAEELGVQDNLVCTDQLPLEEAKSCYAAADIFTFASQSETQGLVVGEAMISGVPVVALYSPIQPEVYPEGTALIANNVSEFTSKIVEALNDKQLRQKLAATGKKFVETNFTKEMMIQKQLRTFELAMEKQAVASPVESR